MRFVKSPLATVPARYGLYAGIIAAALLIAVYYIGTHPLMVPAFLDFRILLFGLFIFFGVKEFREHYHHGVLYFWQGMIGSYIIIFIASAVASIGLFIFAELNQTFITSFIEQRTAFLKAFPEEEIKRIGKEVFDRNLDAGTATNSSHLDIVYFAQGILISHFIRNMLSAILRRQRKTH